MSCAATDMRARVFVLMTTVALVASLAACAPAGHEEVPEADAPREARPIVSDALADNAGEASHRTRVAAAFAAGEVASVRLIGDSITDGEGCDGFGARTERVIYRGANGTRYESAPTLSCWANDFREYALAAGVAADAFVNAGISGARMAWLADDPDAWLADGADVICVMLGTNDAVWSTPEEYAANAEAALAAASSASGHLVVLSPPNNLRTDGRSRFGMDEVDAILTRICEERGYEHVSMLDVVSADDGSLNADLIHPTSHGSHLIWARLRETLGL